MPTTSLKMEVHDLIERNSRLLLLMDHFGTGFTVADLTVSQFCNLHNIKPELFASFCNLYNGDKSELYKPKNIEDVAQIIDFLERSHQYYINEMYPEIKHYIHKLSEINDGDHVKMLENFFDSYFDEVIKHLKYEQNELFPLIREYCNAVDNKPELLKKLRQQHRNTNQDIEIKLKDLKNLLLKHIRLVDSNGYKRKLLTAIFDFQYDLNIHSVIEDKILMAGIG